jgi:hypothetical protein
MAAYPYDEELLPTIPLDQWRSLHEAADRVRQLEPWKTLTETDIFGLEDPLTKQIGVVSVLGNLGEVYAVHLHLPPEGLQFWLQFFRTGEPDRHLGQFKMRMLETHFVPKRSLTKPDLIIRQQLGLPQPVSRAHAYPAFRSYRPRCGPWYIGLEEARLLELSLAATLEFTARRRRREEADLLNDGLGIEFPVLSIYASAENGPGAWTIRRGRPPVEPAPVRTPVIKEILDEGTLDLLPAVPIGAEIWQAGASFLPSLITDGGRPYYAVVPLIVEEEHEMVLETTVDADLELEPAWSVVRAVAALAIKGNRLPRLIRVGTKEAERALGALRDYCPGLRIALSPQLDLLHSAMLDLHANFGRFSDD